MRYLPDSAAWSIRPPSIPLPSLWETRLTLSEVFGFVYSFPLLEDLSLVSIDNGSEVDGWSVPSISPRLTGSPNLRLFGGIHLPVHPLLDLINGLRFTKIAVSCLYGDVKMTMSLVSKCSDTLESLGVFYHSARKFFSRLPWLANFSPLSLTRLHLNSLGSRSSKMWRLDLVNRASSESLWHCRPPNPQILSRSLSASLPA